MLVTMMAVLLKMKRSCSQITRTREEAVKTRGVEVHKKLTFAFFFCARCSFSPLVR